MPCPPGHTIYHAMPRQSITYTMPWLPGHTIYLTMPARSYHIPCHATANNYFGKSCHLIKGANVSLSDARLFVNSLMRWFRFIVCLCGTTSYTEVSNCIDYFLPSQWAKLNSVSFLQPRKWDFYWFLWLSRSVVIKGIGCDWGNCVIQHQ